MFVLSSYLTQMVFTCALKGTAAKRLKGLSQPLQKLVYYTDFSVFYLMSHTET